MGNMFKHTPLAAEAKIVQLERQLAALRAAAKELNEAQMAWDDAVTNDELGIAYERLYHAKEALKALLGALVTYRGNPYIVVSVDDPDYLIQHEDIESRRIWTSWTELEPRKKANKYGAVKVQSEDVTLDEIERLEYVVSQLEEITVIMSVDSGLRARALLDNNPNQELIEKYRQNLLTRREEFYALCRKVLDESA